MKKLIVVLLAVIFAGVNSMALAGKGESQTDNATLEKDNNKTTVATKKPVNPKKPSVKKPVVTKTAANKTVSKGKGGAKSTSGNGIPNGIINNGKPNTKNPKSAGSTKNGAVTANNPGL